MRMQGQGQGQGQMRRKFGGGRASGSDGSDFNYRMAVDSGYTIVAQGKSRLSSLFLLSYEGFLTFLMRNSTPHSEAALKLFGASKLFHSDPEEEILDTLSLSSTFLCFISLIIGEIGRKCRQVNVLKFYVFLSVACVSANSLPITVSEDLSGWEMNKSQLFKTAGVLVGLLVQTFSITTTLALNSYYASS